MMSKIQNIAWNCLAVFLIIASYVFLRVYSDFYYIQIVQKIFVSIIFVCGLIIIINNSLYLKVAVKKYFTIILLLLGIAVSIYSGFVLYLILALQNTGF